jgi:hypothetical protein
MRSVPADGARQDTISFCCDRSIRGHADGRLCCCGGEDRSSTPAGTTGDGGASPLFAFATAGASARGQETDDGFVVLAGSTARKGATGTFPAGYLAQREQLIVEGKLVDAPGDEIYRFAVDTVSPAPAPQPPSLRPVAPAGRASGSCPQDRCTRAGRPAPSSRADRPGWQSTWTFAAIPSRGGAGANGLRDRSRRERLPQRCWILSTIGAAGASGVPRAPRTAGASRASAP